MNYDQWMADGGIQLPCPECGTQLNMDIGVYVSAADGSTGSVQAEIGDVPARVFDAIMSDEVDDDDADNEDRP